MDYVLSEGQSVITEASGTTCRVEQFLGGGGQGEVYRADMDGQQIALKWYYPHYLQSAPRLRERLATAIEYGPPSDRFLWPLELAELPDGTGLGYVMRLRGQQFKSIVDLMTQCITPVPTFRALSTSGLELADSFLQLHSKGLCYRDISFGNVFFDPSSGEIQICDNDNVDIDGQPGEIKGTPRFMAPEVVRGDATPSATSDLFSLAVLLFYLFMIHHPLDGQKEADIHAFDQQAMMKLYGEEPVFIYDPVDKSNQPVPGYHDNALVFWPIYPKFLQDLFTKAFTDGIRDPGHGRVREPQWRNAMIRLRDSIVYCANCAGENFYDLETVQASGGQPGACWSCRRQLVLPPRIRIGENIIMLNHDTKLFPHHVDRQRMFDFSSPVAEVTRHPTDPSLWGLKNLTSETWGVVTEAGGGINIVDPDRSVSLRVGTKVNFGKLEGEIRL